VDAIPRAPRTAPARRAATREGALTQRLVLAFGSLLLLLVMLTGVAFVSLQGAAAVAVLGLGVAAVALAFGMAAWLVRRLAAPALRASAAATRMSAGDLTHPISADAGGELQPLLRALEEVRERLFSVVGQVRAGTTHVAMNSSQVTRDNEALSLRTNTQAESLQQTAATMEQLTAAVRQNAETAQQANALVRSATERAEQGGTVMNEVVATMGAIRDGSQSIREIIGVIDGIAFQTNILALNAAVEAARAGDQGRGFAVVAGEVRTLAQRCAGAAREIRELIGASVEQVQAGGRRVDEAGRSMAEIVTAVRKVAGLIGQIDAASREQSEGIESINDAVARIDRTTQANAALVQDAAKTAAALHGRAVTLMKGVALFDLGDREHGSAEEAVRMVREACAFHHAHGRDALIAEVNRLAEGRFIDRDLYLMVLRADDCVFLAHGNNPRTLGSGPQSKDVDGKAFVREMAEVARRRGEGWVDYKWAHPVTNEVLTKSTFVQRAGDVVVACGIYR
ncbi:MAG TPA: methyl-accepting chemotaxis protein, partial [Ramlibacter sp.]|nr:methyl-accepting chemotaxis protein [Ramlibacter sp.]